MMVVSPEYCPVSMGAEVVAERWNLLIVRELLTGAQRFNDIHRGLPGLSRTLLSQRLRMLQRCGLVESRATGDAPGGGYRLTEAGADLQGVLEALGEWAVRWRFPEPKDDQLNPHLLLWRMQSGLRREHLPARRIVIEFSFDNSQPAHGWLVLTGEDSSVCARDPLFEVDIYANASSHVWHEIWFGHRSLRESISNGDVVLTGQKDLIVRFADWFQLSHFAGEVAARRSARTPSRG
jgi:DNA-binding HxlR family transcriptional regulator